MTEHKMPLTPGFIRRAQDTTGDQIKTFTDGSGYAIQAASLVDENATQVGTASNPMPVLDTGAWHSDTETFSVMENVT